MAETTFPGDFLWGVAAASYQIEGHTDPDGPAASVWDAFCKRPGAVFEGHTGYKACDHYSRYADDIALIAELGAKAYRLSISWPRILPDGLGQPVEQGLDFYDRVIDTLLSRGITPWVTLFHWDMPLSLFNRGGWLNRESADWFEHYTAVLAERLGDRVQHWMTFNEPQVFLGLGHYEGTHAPGMKYSQQEVLLATHNVLRAHGKSVQALRNKAAITPIIGWAPHGSIPFPASNDVETVEIARRKMFEVANHEFWHFSTSWYSDPVILGEYPEEGLSYFGTDMPANFEKDLDGMKQPLDFFGVNIYQGHPIELDESGNPQPKRRRVGFPHTMCHWPIDPEALYWGPRFLAERYGLPLYITENGCASMDWVHQDGMVHDAPRIDYLARHLTALQKAIADGVDIRGYFQWSFMDNFEWAEGYRMRFGLIYVDYETMERIPKDSYAWYQQVILSNGACLPENPAPLR